MGRPINKKFFGGRDSGVTGSYNQALDPTAKMAGLNVASVGSITAGSYTAAPTLQFPLPLAGNGVTAARATGTPTFKVVSATISGGTGYGNAQTFNLTVTTAAGSAVLNVTSSAGGALTTVNSITTAGTFTGISAVTGISGGTGSGATPVLTYGLLGATLTNNGGDGYTTETFNSYITASTAGANITTSSISTTGTGGQFSLGTAQSAGTFFVGQVVTLTGTAGGTGSITGYTTGNAYVVTATNGTSTFTLAQMVNGVQTAVVTTAGTITGLTLATAGTFTFASMDGVAPSAQVVLSNAGIGGISTGTYYVVASGSWGVVLASSYAGFFNPTTSTLLAPTTGTNSSKTARVATSQYLGIAITGGTGSGGAMSAVLATPASSGYAGDYLSIVASAFINGQLYENCDIVKQEGSRSFRVLSPVLNTYPGTFCQLVGAQPASNNAPQMAIGATDSDGSTYWVYKLTNKKAYLVPNKVGTGVSTFQFPSTTTNGYTSYSSALWTTGGVMVTSAVANVSVVIDHA